MFLYYFPGISSEELTDYSVYDLDHLNDQPLTRGEVRANGPDGGSGAIRATGSLSGAYVKERQTWVQSGDIWIGYESRPELPALLRRNTKGFLVPTCLGDLCISPVRYMPRVVKLNGNGEVEFEPKPEFAEVASLAQEVLTETLECYSEGKEVDLKPKYVQLAIMAISANYFIGRHECNVLGVLDDQTIYQVNRAVMDIDSYMIMADKKKADD